MKYMSLTSIAAILLVSACTTTKSAKLGCLQTTSKFESLPEYRVMVHDDEKLLSIEIDEDCGGVEGIQNIPDGWSFSAVAKGEDYKILITPPENYNSIKSYREAPALSTIFRGEWSDCYSLSITVAFIKNENTAYRKFKQENGLNGAWVEY